MTAQVYEIRRTIARLQCSSCGAEANASCDCGKPYVPAGARAAAAVAANPEKSDRAIAADIGVSRTTVQRARDAGGPYGPPDAGSGDTDLSPESDQPYQNEKRAGRDGKTYPAKRKIKRHRRMTPPIETEHDRDLRSLLGLWECTCESARTEFLSIINH